MIVAVYSALASQYRGVMHGSLHDNNLARQNLLFIMARLHSCTGDIMDSLLHMKPFHVPPLIWKVESKIKGPQVTSKSILFINM